jgi:DNA-binding NarL/FixJ family response regulator
MSTPRKKKSSRTGSQQTNTYFHVLDTPLRLVNRKDPAAQENRSSNAHSQPPLSGGRRSTDSDLFGLYDLWLSLSEREQDVTYLTCLGYKNHQIAFRLGISMRTVRSYIEQVFFKTHLHSKTELRLKFANFDFKRHTRYE